MVSYGPTSSDLAVREPSAFSVKVWLKRPRPPVASQLTIHGEPFTSTSRRLPSNLGFVGLEAQARNSPAARRANTIILGVAHRLLLHADSDLGWWRVVRRVSGFAETKRSPGCLQGDCSELGRCSRSGGGHRQDAVPLLLLGHFVDQVADIAKFLRREQSPRI